MILLIVYSEYILHILRRIRYDSAVRGKFKQISKKVDEQRERAELNPTRVPDYNRSNTRADSSL